MLNCCFNPARQFGKHAKPNSEKRRLKVFDMDILLPFMWFIMSDLSSILNK